MTKEKKHFETLSIHAGKEKDQHHALNAPIYMTSTFTFDDIQRADDAFSFNSKDYVYTRGNNPTIKIFEERMAALESGIDGVAFASGMGAVTSTLLSLAKEGDEILAHRNLYGSSFSAISKLFSQFGIGSNFINMTNVDSVGEAISPKTKVIFFETPTNPSLEIIDIEEIVKIAHAANVKVVIDNTFATPYFQRPLELGADVVLHSATKYISGHGDVLGGVAVSRDEKYLFDLKFNYMCELGPVISPFNAWILLRGMKTLSLRMQKHEENAKSIVEFLLNHPKVERVTYPALSDHKNYAVAKKQMSGFGGIISFELFGNTETAKKFVNNLKLAKLAVSLGDAETLVEIPALMTHRSFLEKEMKEFGFSSKTIRISTGLEHHSDIVYDIEQAIDKL